MPREKAVPFLFLWRALILEDDKLSAADKHVALTLSMHMMLDGTGPKLGMRRIAFETSRKTGTVAASLKALEHVGYITVTRAAGAGKTVRRDVNVYTATYPQWHTWAKRDVCQSARDKYAQGHTKLLSSYSGATKNAAAVMKCESCGAGLDHAGHAIHGHADDCELAQQIA